MLYAYGLYYNDHCCDYECICLLCQNGPWSEWNAANYKCSIKIKLFAGFNWNIYVHCTMHLYRSLVVSSVLHLRLQRGRHCDLFCYCCWNNTCPLFRNVGSSIWNERNVSYIWWIYSCISIYMCDVCVCATTELRLQCTFERRKKTHFIGCFLEPFPFNLRMYELLMPEINTIHSLLSSKHIPHLDRWNSR